MSNQLAIGSGTNINLNSTVSASNLHFDLLTEIFSICFDANPISIRDAPTTRFLDELSPRPFANVCRHWRAAALSAPRLWAQWSIFLRVQSGAPATDMIFDAVCRFVEDSIVKSGSANMVFEIKFELGGVDMSGRWLARVDSLVVLLVGQQSRWERASIEIFCNGSWGNGGHLFGQWSLSPKRLQSLQELSLSGHQYLKYLRPRDMSSIATHALKSLRVNFTSLKNCKIWLSRFPNLLAFKAHIMHNGPDINVGHMDLRSLKVIQLSNSTLCSTSPPMLGLLLDSMTCRALERLSISGQVGNARFGGFLNKFLERSQPSALSTLILHDVAIADVLPCLQQLSRLSSLHVCCTPADSGILGALMSRDVCPQLASISLMDVEAADGDFILFITSRWNIIPRRLQTVRLTRCTARNNGNHFTHKLREGLSPAWAPVKVCIEEGLVLECLSTFDHEQI